MRKSRIEAVQKIGLRYRSTPLGDNTHSPFSFVKKALNRIESQFFRNDSIVTDFGVSVQRQMESEHRDAVIHQLAETFCKFPNRELALAFPEAIRVMDNNAIRLLGNGSINQLVAQAHARHDFRYFVVSFNTKAIHTEIVKRFRIKQIIKPSSERRQIHKRSLFSLVFNQIIAMPAIDIPYYVTAWGAKKAYWIIFSLPQSMHLTKFTHRENFNGIIIGAPNGTLSLYLRICF